MLKLTTADYKRLRADTLLIPVCEKKNIHTDPAVKAVVKDAQQLPEFSGKKDEVVLLYAPKQLKAKRVLLRGLGSAEELDAETLRAAAGNAVKDCIQKKLNGLWVAVPDVKKLPLDTEATLRALMEGGCLANHIFDKFRKEKKHKPLRQVTFALPKRLVSRFRNISRQIETVCTGTVMARDWISTPANAKTPEQFAADIAANAKKAGLKTQVIKENQLERQGMGALLSVCRGSKSAPHLVVLDHNPAFSDRSCWSEKALPLIPAA